MSSAVAFALVIGIPMGIAGSAVAGDRETPPDNSGPVKLLTASWLGGGMDDEIVAAEVLPDLTIVLAGNSADLTVAGVTATVFGEAGRPSPDPLPPEAKKGKAKPVAGRNPGLFGFVVRLSSDGSRVLGFTRFGHGIATIRKLRSDAPGRLHILGECADGKPFGPPAGKGTFVATLPADASKITACIWREGTTDFGVDGNGDLVLLHGAKMTRFSPDGAEKWSVGWKSHGGNRPGGMTLSAATGVAAVVGYGMTHTSKEPYKDPYGFGFDREGKQIWSLWNPDPKLQVDAKFGGNGLMADTTGRAAFTDADGKILFLLYADGGNSICTRDPADPNKPIAPAVYDGVFQKGPGHGFKGASQTSVIFRIDPATGTLEKGTWMCSWVSPQRANGLRMDAAAGDGKGRTFVAGNSAANCPTKLPWYVATEPDGYKGGGYLAAFDKDFRMVQCGYFPGTTMTTVAARNGVVVVAGSAKHFENEDKDGQGGTVPTRIHKPVQPAFGGGRRDAWFAVFKAE